MGICGGRLPYSPNPAYPAVLFPDPFIRSWRRLLALPPEYNKLTFHAAYLTDLTCLGGWEWGWIRRAWGSGSDDESNVLGRVGVRKDLGGWEWESVGGIQSPLQIYSDPSSLSPSQARRIHHHSHPPKHHHSTLTSTPDLLDTQHKSWVYCIG